MRNRILIEADWWTSTHPYAMLVFLRDRDGGRKFRLFACACGRRVEPLVTKEESRQALAVSEQYADGLVSRKDLEEAHRLAREVESSVYPWIRPYTVGDYANLAAASTASPSAFGAALALVNWCAVLHDNGDELADKAHLAAILRDIFGNPFRPVCVDPAWVRREDGRVAEIAWAIYDHRWFNDLPILADALEEVGCTDREILAHCRGQGLHVRGCWVVDALLDVATIGELSRYVVH